MSSGGGVGGLGRDDSGVGDVGGGAGGGGGGTDGIGCGGGRGEGAAVCGGVTQAVVLPVVLRWKLLDLYVGLGELSKCNSI
jgi:hypothetical protein